MPDDAAVQTSNPTMGTLTKKTVRWTVVAAVLTLLFVLPGAAFGVGGPINQRSPRAGTTIPGQYIVMLQPSAAADGVQRAYDVANAHAYSHLFNGFSGTIPAGRLNALKNDPRVEAVIPDRLIKGDPGPPGRPSKTTSPSSETPSQGVTAIGAGPSANLGVSGAGVGIAVLDTGVDRNHFDLNVAPTCFDAFGGDCTDDSGHGTHVSGIAAAIINGSGIIGVAPSATIYPVKVLDAEKGGGDSDLIAGMEWVLTNAKTVNPPIKVVNMSLGRPGTLDDNKALRTAVQSLVNAGIVVVASAGNDPLVPANDQVPAAYPEVITVASDTASQGTSSCSEQTAGIAKGALSFFSSYSPRSGATGVDIVAPGEVAENVSQACLIDTSGILSDYPGNSMAYMSGTSMAAPLVSGVAALLFEKDPLLTPAQVSDAIRNGASTGVKPSALGTDASDNGFLNAPGALAHVP